MSDTTTTNRTWVAMGPAGTIGWVTRVPEGFTFRLVKDDAERGIYPSLDVAKSALHASLVPGTDWPEFSEH